MEATTLLSRRCVVPDVLSIFLFRLAIQYIANKVNHVVGLELEYSVEWYDGNLLRWLSVLFKADSIIYRLTHWTDHSDICHR